MSASTELLYRDDPDRLEFDAQVLARLTDEGRPAVVLDRTAFYPEGGGQPWDTGTLDGVPVLAVVRRPDAVVHVLGGPLAADHVHGVVDATRRRDHRQQHHGQHLLSRAMLDLAGARTVSFHLGAEVSTIDLDRAVGEADLLAAEARTNEIVWQGRPVRVRTVGRAEAQALGVVPPEDAGETVRLVEAEGFDLQACGGTHPRSTADVGLVLVLDQERYKGGSRVRFVCGHRAAETARRQGRILGRLGALLAAPADQLESALQRLLDERTEAARRERDLVDRLHAAEAERLLEKARQTLGPDRPYVMVAVYPGWPAADLRGLAQRLTALEPCVALLASRADKAHLVFARSEGLGHDVAGALQEVLKTLGGRGGGRGNLVQGGSERTEGLEAVLNAAADRLKATAGSGPGA